MSSKFKWKRFKAKKEIVSDSKYKRGGGGDTLLLVRPEAASTQTLVDTTYLKRLQERIEVERSLWSNPNLSGSLRPLGLNEMHFSALIFPRGYRSPRNHPPFKRKRSLFDTWHPQVKWSPLGITTNYDFTKFAVTINSIGYGIMVSTDGGYNWNELATTKRKSPSSIIIPWLFLHSDITMDRLAKLRGLRLA